jgi:hypothetical protein
MTQLLKHYKAVKFDRFPHSMKAAYPDDETPHTQADKKP